MRGRSVNQYDAKRVTLATFDLTNPVAQTQTPPRRKEPISKMTTITTTEVDFDGVPMIEFGSTVTMILFGDRAEIHTGDEKSIREAGEKAHGANWLAAVAELMRRHPDAVLDPGVAYVGGMEVFTATW